MTFCERLNKGSQAGRSELAGCQDGKFTKTVDARELWEQGWSMPPGLVLILAFSFTPLLMTGTPVKSIW